MNEHSVFNRNAKKNQTMFFGEQLGVARYDEVKYPQLTKLTKKQKGYYWSPEVEVELTRDQKDFKTLTKEEEHIFTSNLKRQIILDSVQGRALSAAFGPFWSLPEIELWFKTQEFFELIHSETYSHIIRNVYSDPSKVFDEMLEIKEVADCAKDISEEYDRLIDYNVEDHAQDWITEGWEPPSTQLFGFDPLARKRQLWRTLHAVNALEGIRFYVSFICSWAFAEQGKMEGNAKLIKLICRDENIHLAATQQIIKLLPKDDPDFVQIAVEEKDYVYKLFQSVVDQEKQWAKYLFQKGAMLGLNYEILCQYVDHIAHKRATAIGLGEYFKNVPNPLPWAAKWIAGSEVQVAPQETQITSYVVGGVKNDLRADSFKGFKL